MTQPNSTKPTSTPTKTGPAATGTPDATSTVTAFLDAMGRLDNETAIALLADDVVYQNVSLPAAKGKPAVAKQLRLFEKYLTSFEAINHRIAADGNTVLTERTDVITIGRFKASFWVCGTFEVRDGKIVLWRDYFDWANLLVGSAAGAGRAVAGLVRGALKR